MDLQKEQIEQFKEIHKDFEDFKNYSEEEISGIANGVANYYLTLFKIYQRLKKESSGTSPTAEG